MFIATPQVAQLVPPERDLALPCPHDDPSAKPKEPLFT